MKVLAVGDIVGNAGVKELKDTLPIIKKEKKIDFVIVNGENSAQGMGITEKNFRDILSAGADVVTMGNHTWGKKDIFSFIDDPKIIRPANYPEGVVGKGYNIYNKNGKNIAVINLIGRVDMSVLSENPFLKAKKIIEDITSIENKNQYQEKSNIKKDEEIKREIEDKKFFNKEKADIIIVDFHAEATAEKIAMGYFLDGKATAVYGTHTHVQTADEKILPQGTGYITDIGMTGPKNSVIGMDIKVSFKRFETTLPERYKIAEGECMFNSVMFEIDDNTNKVTRIERISKK